LNSMKLGVELPCLRKGDLGRIEQAVAIQTPAVARCRLKAGDDQRDCRRCTSVRQRRKPKVFREGIESPSNTRGDPFRKCVLNIAADVAAMGEVAELVIGFNRHMLTVVFVVGTLLLQVFVPYHHYVFFLKWLTLSLLAYAAVLFTVHVPWGQVALHTFWPNFALNSDAATVIVGVFGTTISPYLFFWQASEEVEDMQSHQGAEPLVRDRREAGAELRRISWDTWSGMFYSDIIAYFIILATAVTLNVAGVKDIETAAQAASALRPWPATSRICSSP
jgi:Mn2+/Fe2+ NRAMP family transporter